MKMLMDATGYVSSKYTLTETFYISESTLYHALTKSKAAKAIRSCTGT